MSKIRKSHPELYILLFLGIDVQRLEKKGYSINTIYAYNRKLPGIRKKLNEMI